MKKTIYVDCSCCGSLLEVDADTGKVLHHWSKGDRSLSSDDKLKAALHQIEENSKKRVSLFDQTRQELEEKKKKRDDIFKTQVDRIKKEGVQERPDDPFKWD